jgi:tyrosyl-tRNA synthetase
MQTTYADFIRELSWRGLLFQTTEGAEAALAAGSVAGYCGFDPTADSLHVGSLVPIMTLVHLQRAGHRPIALVGGGTGMIGDPSGKTTERQLLDAAAVERNAAGIRGQLERFLDFSGERGAVLANNAAWLAPLSLLDFLRDTGKHFTVNYMLQKESVKGRMDNGISFTEFSYMLLQAYDFLALHRTFGATLQVGGSDQFGNITAGTELIRRTEGKDAFGVTVPLVTSASGTKFGKTESGTIWLDAARTSPYKFYQFWLNTDDRDVSRYLRFFTLLDRNSIQVLDTSTQVNPGNRLAQYTLAEEVTTRVHGELAFGAAMMVSGFLFAGLAPSELSDDALRMLAAEIPFTECDAASLSGEGENEGSLDVYKLLTACGLADSNGAAKRLLQQGGISVNKRKLSADERFVPRAESLLRDGHVVIGKGKRDFALVRVRA